jgi:hypothetical protein
MESSSVDHVRSKIEEVRAGAKAHLFKDLVPVVPSWGQFISHLNDAIHNYQPSTANQPLEERIINGVIQRGLFYLMVDGPRQDHFPESKAVYDIFNEALDAEISPVSAFINFIGKERPGGVHIDNRETIYWQCIGKATWRIYENHDDKVPVLEYTLEPGDVIYVAEHVNHQIRADEPRAAIGFQYRPNDQNFKRNKNQQQ